MVIHSCVLDRTLLNEGTILNLSDLNLSILAPLCGKNRGVFVVDPPDGKTYSCVELPTEWSSSLNVALETANDIDDLLLDSTITPLEAVDVLDKYVDAVYRSSPFVDGDPYACNANGLATLDCPDTTATIANTLFGDGLRSVTLQGLFVDAPWITGVGVTLSTEEAKEFYSVQDFTDMIQLGINTLQIPMDTFNDEIQQALSHIFEKHIAVAVSTAAGTSGRPSLSVLLNLVQGFDGEVADVARFCDANNNGGDVACLGMILPSMDDVESVRTVSSTMPLLVAINGGDILSFAPPDDYVFAALDMTHTATVADIASSTSFDDRGKLYYHEAIACNDRTPIEYMQCYHGIPVYVSTGFDASIDDCILKGAGNVTSTSSSTQIFKDYGQCDRYGETVNSGWWSRHRASFVARQKYTYERASIGWSFSAWKVADPEGPAGMVGLKHVSEGGLWPVDDAFACLNPPVNDFAMGDSTYPPTRAPVDCGNGWWDESTQGCTYWIPPPPTPAPTLPKCPLCPNVTGEIAAAVAAAVAAANKTNAKKSTREESHSVVVTDEEQGEVDEQEEESSTSSKVPFWAARGLVILLAAFFGSFLTWWKVRKQNIDSGYEGIPPVEVKGNYE